MVKKEIYPKTQRIKENGEIFTITEKLDGSNCVFFKKDNTLYIALRKTIITLDELEEYKHILYKDMYNWLSDYGKILEELLNNNSAICGEWLGMGNINYEDTEIEDKYYMFAKANIDDDYHLYNISYDENLFIYPFINKEIPSFIKKVPIVVKTTDMPTKEYLDNLYDVYIMSVNRLVEGFVISYYDIVRKYIRMKKGKLVEYSENDRKKE